MGNNRLGYEIKRLREASNLSQDELADKTDISRSYISKLERGLVDKISVVFLTRLAKGLGIDENELMDAGGLSPRSIKVAEMSISESRQEVISAISSNPYLSDEQKRELRAIVMRYFENAEYKAKESLQANSVTFSQISTP